MHKGAAQGWLFDPCLDESNNPKAVAAWIQENVPKLSIPVQPTFPPRKGVERLGNIMQLAGIDNGSKTASS